MVKMSSKAVIIGKNNRKAAALRCRKLSSTSRSQISFSHSHLNAVSGVQKRRITALLKNNKALANALEDVRSELSYKEYLLKDCTKNLNNMMYARVKMLDMQSSLKSFMTSFEEALMLLKQDDTKWPMVGLTTLSRVDFKRKMKKGAIDVVDEASEIDPMILEHENISNNTCQTNDHGAFNFEIMPTECQTELKNKPSQELVEQMIVNADANVLNQSHIQLPEKFIQNEESVQPCVHDVNENSNGALSFNERLEIDSIDNIEPQKDYENYGTPKLSLLPPIFTSPINLNPLCDSDVGVHKNIASPLAVNKISDAPVEPPAALSSAKAMNSKIPRMLDFSQKNQNKTAIDTLSREKVSKDKNSSKKIANITELVPNCSGKGISFAKKTETFTENLRSLDGLNETESKQKGISVNNNENSLKEEHVNFYKQKKSEIDIFSKELENVIKKTENVKELDPISRRGTFFVRNTETLTNGQKSLDDFNEAELNKESSSIHKNENNMGGKQKNFSRRKTFVVKTSVKESGHETKSSDRRKTFVKKLDNIDENVSSKNRRGTFVINNIADKVEEKNCNEIDIVACSASKNFQNETVLSKNGHEIQVTLPVIDVNVHKSSISTVNEHNMKCTDLPSQNHTLESKQNMVNMEVCETVRDACFINNAAVFDNAANQTELLNDANKISVEHSFNEVEEKSTENVKVAKKLSKDNESDAEERSDIEILNEIQNEDDITILDTPIRRKKSGFRKRISYKDFLTSSESECELLSDIDDRPFKEVSVIKKTPIRKQIPVNKKKKVFVFSASERKSILSRECYSICGKVQESCSTVQSENQTNDDVANYQSNNGNVDYVSKSNPFYENQSEKSCKSVTFADSIIYSESMFNSQSKTSKNSSTESNAQPQIKVPVEVKDSTKIVKESNEKNNIKVKREKNSTELDAFNYKENIHPQDIRNFNRIDCIDTHKLDDENNSNEIVESTKVHCSDVVRKTKPKKSQKVKRNVKRSRPFDDILEDDLISDDKKIMSKNKKKMKENLPSVDDIIAAVSSNIDIDDRATENVPPKENKKKGRKKKVKKNSPSKVQVKNTFLVHAEIHPPPPGLNISQTKSLPKEEKKIKKEQLRLSVVLSDIFESEDVNKLNICDGNLFVLKDRTSFPSKTVLSDKVCNIQTAESTHQDIPKPTCNLDEIGVTDNIDKGRRYRKPVSYAEPSLNKKMRR